MRRTTLRQWRSRANFPLFVGLIKMIWEAVQGLGALVGLATGAFVLWERVTRDRPNAYFVAMPVVPHGSRFLYLRVSNQNPRPMFVFVENGSRNGELRISQDDSARAIIASVLTGESTFVLEGSSQFDYPVLKPPDYEGLDPDSEMRLEIRWRFAQPILWRPWQRRTLSLSKRSYQTLLSEFDIVDDDD